MGERRNLTRKAHLDQVTRFAALQQAQDTVGDEAADSPADGVVGETRAPSEPEDGELQLQVSFQAAVAKEMRVDDAVGSRELQTRDE